MGGLVNFFNPETGKRRRVLPLDIRERLQAIAKKENGE